MINLVCKALLVIVFFWITTVLGNRESNFNDYLFLLVCSPFLYLPSAYLLFMSSQNKQLKRFEYEQNKIQEIK